LLHGAPPWSRSPRSSSAHCFSTAIKPSARFALMWADRNENRQIQNPPNRMNCIHHTHMRSPSSIHRLVTEHYVWIIKPLPWQTVLVFEYVSPIFHSGFFQVVVSHFKSSVPYVFAAYGTLCPYQHVSASFFHHITYS
jgi:hypothetical protein